MRSFLTAPLHQLGLELERSRFAPLISTVGRELEDAGIALVPRFYLSTEYGCIVRSATIGLLWTDGFDFGRRLARAHGIRSRTLRQVLPTLRHEVGHAFCYAHQLYRSSTFRRLFGVEGRFFESYPDVWRPSAKDRHRHRRGEVIYLYGSRHPDEDFAICFQVWLAAAGTRLGFDGLRRSYRDRPVILKKLEYVRDVVAEVGSRVPAVQQPPLDEPVHEVELTVGEWIASVLNGNNYNLLVGSPTASPDMGRPAR